MSRIPQAKGGSKSNLAKALAAGTRAAGGASGRTSDKGRSHSRSRSPRTAVPLHAAWKGDTVLSRAVGRSPRSAEDPEGVVPCDRDHDAHRNHVWDLFLQNKISKLEAFNASVAVQASGARRVADVAGADHYGRWKGNLARDVRRAILKDVDKPNVYRARIPCKDLATGAAKTPKWCPFLLVHEVLASLVAKHAEDVSSFAAIPQQLWGMKRHFCAKHGINGDLTLGLGLLGDGVAHQKRTTVECFSWNVLGSHIAERYLFGLVEKDAW